jgi:hypothetical protein
MPAQGPAKAIIRVAALLFACSGLALPQSPEPGLFVKAVQPGTIETKPLNSVTLVFRVANQTGRPHVFSPQVELPEGWKLVIEEMDFPLEGGGEAVRLVSVFVPVKAKAGNYRIGYAVGASDEPALAGRAEAEVEVLLEARLVVEALDVHHLAVAGDKCQSRFLVTNRSNAPLDVRLGLKSNGPHVSQDLKGIRLEAGEARPVDITVSTDRGLGQKLSQQVQLTAEASVLGKETVAASAMTELEIIPRISGKADYFNELPAEIGFMAIGSGGAQGYSQFKLSGAGALDNLGNHRLDFFFRGPGRGLGRDIFYQFGLQPEEYRLSYDSSMVNVHAGDGVYSLTRLTENGNYGRGLEAGITLRKWSLHGYFERIMGLSESGREKALQLGYRPFDNIRFDLSYMTRQDPQRPAASRIFSLQSRFTQKNLYGNLEYSWDSSSDKGFRPASTAFWLEGGATFKKLNARANIIRSGADFHGYYENLDYGSAEVTYASAERWGLRASYLDQKRHTAIEPYFQPFYDRTFQVGAYYQAFRRLSLSLDERIHDRQDLSGQAAFNYRDTTLRLGAFSYFGTFGIQSFLDIGRTLNKLTRESERLTEYTISGNCLVINRISLAAYLHYRDQDLSFTGDKTRGLDINFNAGFQLGRLEMNAFYRTALLHEFYRSALSRESFEDPAFLLNNYDFFGANIIFRFRNGHSLGFRVQRVANPLRENGLPAKRSLGLVEYSIPVGFPVNRKTTVGMLRGRVFDSENGGQGVPGMIVRVNDFATVTNKKGEYVFNCLKPGSYVLTLDDRHAGSDLVTVEKIPMSLVVEGGKKTDCPIGLTTGGRIGDRVMVYDFAGDALKVIQNGPDAGGVPSAGSPSDPDSGSGAKSQLVERTPLAGTAVELRGEGDVFEQVTDGQGRFLFEGLRPGRYVLRVYDDNLPEFHAFEQDTFELDLEPAGKEEITIRVVPVSRAIQIIDQGEVKIKKKKAPSGNS